MGPYPHDPRELEDKLDATRRPSFTSLAPVVENGLDEARQVKVEGSLQ